MQQDIPIYSIPRFQSIQSGVDFYANDLNPHVREHHFTHLPHKHDFYLIVLFISGTGRHEVDFESFPIERGSLFFMKPGQMHFWELSEDVQGFVFFHTKDFYDKGFLSSSVNNFEFYRSQQSPPMIRLQGESFHLMMNFMLSLVNEYQDDGILKWQKIHALVNLIYVEISRNYTPSVDPIRTSYLSRIRVFEDLVEKNYKEWKFPKDYAKKMNISSKHLNRMAKSCLNKTCTELIHDRLLLEAKRLLMHSDYNVKQVSDELGFTENSYFVRFFKRKTGITPFYFFKNYGAGSL